MNQHQQDRITTGTMIVLCAAVAGAVAQVVTETLWVAVCAGCIVAIGGMFSMCDN